MVEAGSSGTTTPMVLHNSEVLINRRFRSAASPRRGTRFSLCQRSQASSQREKNEGVMNTVIVNVPFEMFIDQHVAVSHRQFRQSEQVDALPPQIVNVIVQQT